MSVSSLPSSNQSNPNQEAQYTLNKEDDRKKERERIRERRMKISPDLSEKPKEPPEKPGSIHHSFSEKPTLREDLNRNKLERTNERPHAHVIKPKSEEIAAEERRRRIEKAKQDLAEKKKILQKQTEEEKRKLSEWQQSFNQSLASPAKLSIQSHPTKLIKEWEISKEEIVFQSDRIAMEADYRNLKLKDGKYCIGKGGFGAIYLVEYNNTLAAMKRTDTFGETNANQEFVQELGVLLRLRHPNIILYLGGSANTQEQFFLTELMECDLNYLIKQKDSRALWQNEGKYYALDIIRAITYIHRKNLVHKDVKTPNILIKRGCAKLGDFGLAKSVGNTIIVTQDRAYSAAWASPEQINPKSQITFPTDIYSFAIVIWEILSQQEPWEGCTNLQLMFATASGQFKDYHPFPPDTPKELTDLCLSSWSLNPADRPTADYFVTTLEKLLATKN
uniref:Protein kinase domain-containing protein n=1 Tax=Arcella intermedia TaxID=1963864 RepID=A0A6B2L3Y6_9EUKA